MKLKAFNTTNIATSKVTAPYIQVNTVTGLFNINKSAADKIGLKDNDLIQFLQDEEQPDEWYIEKVKENGFQVRYKENVGGGLLFNSTILSRLIFKSVNCEMKSGRIYLGEKTDNMRGRNVFNLVTASLNKISV